jgi:hypothetical protein
MVSNYPDGVNGGEDYFNPPDKTGECPACYADTDWEWLYCPWCGTKLRPDEWMGDEYIGSQQYDCARDWEVDKALDRMEAD